MAHISCLPTSRKRSLWSSSSSPGHPSIRPTRSTHYWHMSNQLWLNFLMRLQRDCTFAGGSFCGSILILCWVQCKHMQTHKLPRNRRRVCTLGFVLAEEKQQTSECKHWKAGHIFIPVQIYVLTGAGVFPVDSPTSFRCEMSSTGHFEISRSTKTTCRANWASTNNDVPEYLLQSEFLRKWCDAHTDFPPTRRSALWVFCPKT